MLKAIRNICLAALIGFTPSVALAVPPGSYPALNTVQITCANTATQIATNDSFRTFISIVNTTTTAIYYGPDSSVTTSTGSLLPGVVGASWNGAYTGPLYCIVATGTAVLTKTSIRSN